MWTHIWCSIRRHNTSIRRSIGHRKLDIWRSIRHHKRMKTAKKAVITQRQILESKVNSLKLLLDQPRPRSGWLKAIRGALGITTRQLGARLGTTHQVVVRQEERETKGTVTLESL